MVLGAVARCALSITHEQPLFGSPRPRFGQNTSQLRIAPGQACLNVETTETVLVSESPISATLTRDSFSDLFRTMYPALLRYAMRFGLARQAADDVVQETFLRLWRDRNTIVIRISMNAMLYTMVRNRALNVKRDTRRIASDVDVSDALGSVGDSVSDAGIEDEIDARRLREILHAWIDDLPARRAEAFVLSRFHDLSHADIAVIMGLSKRTVDTHILLALRELRVRLDKMQNQESEL